MTPGLQARAFEWKKKDQVITAGAIKVSTICDAILAELLSQHPTTHTQSILTAHLSKIPPDVPSALRVIAQLKGRLPTCH
jgi:hypothetical protein